MALPSFIIYVFNCYSKASKFLGKMKETREKHLALHEAQFENQNLCRSLHLGERRFRLERGPLDVSLGVQRLPVVKS